MRIPSSVTAAAPLVLALLLLSGCAPATSSSSSGGGSGSGSDGGGDTAPAGLDCSKATDKSYELFVDPRLEIEPKLDVYSLDAGKTIKFTDTGANGEYTTYGYDGYYIDDSGTTFPNDAQIFVGAEDTGTFSIEGPEAPSGIDGGPYAGFFEIGATTGEGTTIIARICVVWATSE